MAEINDKKLEQMQKEYQQMVAHLTLANECAARLGVLMENTQDPAPKRGKRKSVLTPEQIATVLAKRRKRKMARYKTIPPPDPDKN